MSIAYDESIYQASTSSTGSTAFDSIFLAPDDIEADRRRTHVVANRVKDPVLRDVLQTFHVTLVHRPSSVAARFYQSTEWATTAQQYIVGDAAYHQAGTSFHWSTNYVFMANEAFTGVHSNFGTNVSLIANEVAGTINLWVNTDKLFANAHRPSVTLAHSQGSIVSRPSDLPSEVSNKLPVAAETVDEIADLLDVPVFHVLKATGIKKRTYHEWKRNAIRRPRLASQGRLWDLYQLVTDLAETMGVARLRSWLHQGNRRLSLLRNGDIDELASEAYSTVAKTVERPQWVNAGSITSSAIPRREVTLPTMDPRDVVES